VRQCERNNSADTRVSEAGRGGGTPGAGAEIPLQPMPKTVVRQAGVLVLHHLCRVLNVEVCCGKELFILSFYCPLNEKFYFFQTEAGATFNPLHNGQRTRSRITALPCIANEDMYIHDMQTCTLFDSISKLILLLKTYN